MTTIIEIPVEGVKKTWYKCKTIQSETQKPMSALLVKHFSLRQYIKQDAFTTSMQLHNYFGRN